MPRSPVKPKNRAFNEYIAKDVKCLQHFCPFARFPIRAAQAHKMAMVATGKAMRCPLHDVPLELVSEVYSKGPEMVERLRLLRERRPHKVRAK